MRKCYLVLFVIIFFLPALAFAQFEPSEHRWTIGYDDGLSLHRFIGDNWDIFIGGGPNDSKNEYNSLYYDVVDTFSNQLTSERTDSRKNEEGHVYLGAGRSILRDDRFWMAGVVRLRYSWSNYQNVSVQESFDSDYFRATERIGHSMNTRLYLGLRPSYDLTSRITLMVKMGVYFSHDTNTYDESIQNGDGDIEKRHYHETTDTVRLYGYYYGLESISFMFRF